MIDRTIPRLEYTDLVAPNRTHDVLLDPREIPLHPLVYNSELYKPSFVTRVHQAVPKAVLADISVIERILGINIDIPVTDQQIGPGIVSAVVLDEIRFGYSRGGKAIDLSFKGTSMGVGTLEGIRPFTFSPNETHPLPSEKIQAYSCLTDGPFSYLHGWSTNNYQNKSLPFWLYARSFAVLFNNLGLDELQQKRPMTTT
jgi:hypothetical protein